jgi:O-antigen/teichoic acid export membrane protein
VLSQVGLGLAGAGPIGLLFGYTIGHAGGSVRLARMTWRQHGAVLLRVSANDLRRAAGRYRRFPLFSSGSALLATAGSQVPALLLSFFYGAHVVGLFALGQRVLAVPLDLLGGSIASVYFGESARVVNVGPAKLMLFFRGTIRRLVIVGFPLVAAVAVPAPWLFRALFGEAWTEAGRYVQVLAVMFFCEFLYRPISSTFDVLERQGLELLRSIIRIVLIVGALLTAGLLDQSPFVSVVLLSAAGAASAIIGIALGWYAIHLAIKREET